MTHFSNRPNDPRFVAMKPPKPFGMARARGAAPTYAGYDGLILVNARAERVPPALVKAVIAAESAFDPGAVSHKGAQGLMQLMPATAAELGVEDALHPSENVKGGTRYLREMRDRLGSWPRALAAYNAGPHRVETGRIPAGTRSYVRRILRLWEPHRLASLDLR